MEITWKELNHEIMLCGWSGVVNLNRPHILHFHGKYNNSSEVRQFQPCSIKQLIVPQDIVQPMTNISSVVEFVNNDSNFGSYGINKPYPCRKFSFETKIKSLG